MSLAAKILTPFLALIIFFAMSTVYSARLITDVLSQLSMVTTSLSELPTSFHEVGRESERVRLFLESWETKPKDKVARELPLKLAGLNARLSEAQIRLEALQFPVEVLSIQRATRGLHASYVQLESSLIYFASERGEMIPEVIDSWRLWIKETYEIEAKLTSLAEQERSRLIMVEREALWSALTFSLFSILLGLALIGYLSYLLAPLKALQIGVSAFERGDYKHRILLKGNSALALLAHALNRMGEAIELRDHQIESQQISRLHQARLATVGRLSAQITHELRNPLSSIGLNSELLGEELDELNMDPTRTHGAQSLLREISREVERLKEITEEYLRFARLPRPELLAVDLNILCGEIIEFCREESSRVSVKLNVDQDPHPSLAWADPNQVRSALLNLIRNAQEALASQGGGHVTLRVRSWGEAIRVMILDDGPGLTSEALDHLFEPFFSTKPQGTGLGLSMVKQIVEAQGGRVEVDEVRASSPLTPSLSSDLKEYKPQGLHHFGASFSIYLPRAEGLES